MKQEQKLTVASSMGPAMSHSSVITSVMFYWCSHRAQRQDKVVDSYLLTKHEPKNFRWEEGLFLKAPRVLP